MKKIWAPWRLSYILSSKTQKTTKKTCVFCAASKAKPSVENLVLHQGNAAFVIMNKFPYANGHLMVIPKRHLRDYSRLTPKEHAEMGTLMSMGMQVLKKVFQASGFNVGMNIGEVSGAGIKDHLHYHVVPRWPGDHNYMPIIADTKVMPEYVEETYHRLLREFQRRA